MPSPQAQGLLAMARSGVADSTSPGMVAWSGGNWGSVYAPGASLPRAFETFRDGQFGPLEPLQPFPIDAPEPPGGRPRPRRWQFPVAWNILVGQPGTEGTMLASFQQQEDYAEQPSIPRALIEKTKADLLNLIGDDLSENIVPTPSSEKAMQGNPAKRADFESRRSEILDFFSDPDPDGHTDGIVDWFNAMLEDNVVLDAVAIHVQPTLKPKAGPANSSLGGLALLSGDSIKPLLTIHGGRPRPPQVAFQQVMWGVPRVDLMDLLADFDPSSTLDDLVALNPILESLMEDADQFGADQLIYAVQNRRNRSPYGFSPVAQSMLAASILFARQLWQFEFFQSGSIPTVFLDPGESVATAEEARALQDAINMLGGDLGSRHQVIVLPPGSKVTDQKPIDLTSQIDEWLTALLCMSFGQSISDLGLTPKLAAMMSPQASRGAAQVASDRTTKTSTIPRAKSLKQTLDRILQKHLGQKDMMWTWGIEEGGESLKDKIDQEIALVGGQLSTVDESRIRLGWEPLGLPETTVPIVKIATGVVPFGSDAMAALAEKPPDPVPPSLPGAGPPPKALPPGGSSGGGKPGGNGNGKPPKPGKPGASDGSGGNSGGATASPAHAGARAAEATDGAAAGSNGSSNGNGSKQKIPPKRKKGKGKSATMAEVRSELEILGRYLRRGKSVADFVPKALPHSALHAGVNLEPVAAVAAVTKAATRLVRRDSHLEPLRGQVSASVASLARQVQTGTLTQAAFVPAATGVLTDAYSQALAAGSTHAADDLGGDATDDWDDEASQRAQAQTPYLADFAAAAALTLAALAGGDASDQAMTPDELGDRADLYGDSLTGAYEQGYGDTATATNPNSVIVWHAEDDACELCDDRNEQNFTEDSLPGFPGDGDFGELCDGGVRCRCYLTYEEPEGDVQDQTDQPSGARANFLGPVTGDEAAAQSGKTADKSFVTRGEAIGWLTKAVVAGTADKAGADALIAWYNNGADGAIDWGSEGDWQACVDVASEHMDDDSAKGFCTLRHMDATGSWPGQEDSGKS